MAISDSYLTFVVDQLGRVCPVTTRKMFGGVSIYCDGLIFGLIADDVLRFKVDDTNRSDFEARGMAPFKPYPDKDGVMPYYEVPGDVLEDVDELRGWVEKAIAVAKAKKRKAGKRARGKGQG